MNNNKIKVTRIISCMSVGGVQSMIRRTLPLFDRDRFEFQICCSYKLGEQANDMIEQGIPVTLMPVRSRLNIKDNRKVARWLREQHCDIVHTHMYASNISGVLAARWAKVPVVISHIHSTHEWRSRRRMWMDAFMDRYRDGYVMVSEGVRKAFYEATKLPPSDKSVVMHNVKSEMPRSSGSDKALREEWGIPGDAPVVGTVARLVPVKALDKLLEAASAILQKNPEVRFVIVGRGKELEKLKAMAAEIGIDKRVIFTGQQIDVHRYYEMFDVFVLCSLTEGCSNVLLEAMNFGLPIVATRVGGNPELLEDERSALLIEPGKAEPLANAIERLITDKEMAGRLGANAAQDVNKNTIESYVENMQNFYIKLYEKKVGVNK